jgi:hypothetical protein
MHVRCWDELVKYGANEIMEREYGQYLTETEHEYSVSLELDCDKIKALGGEFNLLVTRAQSSSVDIYCRVELTNTSDP